MKHSTIVLYFVGIGGKVYAKGKTKIFEFIFGSDVDF